MGYIQRLYSGRIGGLAFLVGDLLSLASFWLIDQVVKSLGGGTLVTVVGIILLLLVFVFVFSVFVRRLHDLDKSGWLTLLALIPLINALLGIILILWPGSHEPNRFGSPPRGYRFLLTDLFALG